MLRFVWAPNTQTNIACYTRSKPRSSGAESYDYLPYILTYLGILCAGEKQEIVDEIRSATPPRRRRPVYMQSVLIMYFICKVSLLFRALYAKSPWQRSPISPQPKIAV